MSDFVFKFRLDYSDLVERSLYNYDREDLDAMDHAFQCKSKGQIVCLLCKTTLSNQPPSTVDLNDHLMSSIHLNACDIEAFNSYHHIFTQLSEEDQYMQVYFSPFKCNIVYCDTCMEGVRGDEVLTHLNSKPHLLLLKSWSHIEMIDVIHQHEEAALDYSKITELDILPHRLQRLAFVNSPLIIQKVGTVNFCVLCKKDFESLEEHYNSKKHQRVAQRLTPFQSLSYFHSYWINQPDVNHHKRRYFLPSGFQEVCCILCRNNISYPSISSHLRSRCRSLEESDPLFEPELKRMVVTDVKMCYPPDIKMMFYPNDLMQKIRSEENLNMFTIQRQLENTQCLLCQEFLEDVMTVAGILVHVRSSEHRSRITNNQFSRPLVAYHEFWMQQKLKSQAKQQYFSPYLKEKQHCRKCMQTCRFKETFEHINKCGKSSSPSSVENLIKPEKDAFKWAQASNSGDSPLEGSEVEEHNSPESYFVTKVKTCEKIPVELKTSDGVDQINNDFSVNDPEQATNLDAPMNAQQYDTKIMCTLYAHFNQRKKSQIPPTKYFLQKRSNFECYCLCCNMCIVVAVMKHVEGKKHQRNINSDEVRKQLASYHKFWLAQTADKQILQVYFNPHIRNFFLCVICNKPVSLEDVIDHPCLSIENKYERFEAPEQYRKFEMKYHEKIGRRLFSKSVLVSKIILNSEMPLALHLDSRIMCFLCGSKMLRDLKLFHKHLLDHCSNMEHVRMVLPCILEYHQFWEQQSCERQACMIHYVPLRKGEMKCAKKHIVSYDQIFEHTTKCPVEDLNKLLRLCDDVIPQSTSVQESPISTIQDSTFEQLNNGDETVSLNGSSNSDRCDKLESPIIDENGDSESEYGESLSDSANGTDDDVVIETTEVTEANHTKLNPAERELMMEIDKLARGKINWAEASNSGGSNSKKAMRSQFVDPYKPGTSQTIEHDVPAEIMEYDNETICTLYPNFNSINRSRRPTVYFLQKRSNIERFCLLCNTRVIGIPVEHTRSKKHLSNSNNYQAQQRLKSYHDFWMAQPADVQLLQVNFNPYSLNGFFCLVCKRPVVIQDIKRHPCLSVENKYESFEVPEEYRNFEMKYNDKIRAKFFSKSFLEVSKTVLNSKMPFGLHFQGKAVCFLCGKRIFRDLGYWHQHLLDHCCKMKEVEVRLYYIQQYHQFWEQQFPDLQICMIHYVPDYRGAMKCAKHHLVFYDQAFIHTKKCPIEGWDKLVKLCKNDVTPESTSSQESPIKHKSSSVERLDSGDESEGAMNGSSSSDMGNKLGSSIKDENCDTSESDDLISFSETANDTEVSAPIKNKMVVKSPEKKNKKVIHAILTPAERALMEEINKLGKKQKKQHKLIPSVEINPSDHVFDLIPNRFKFEILNLGEKDGITFCKLCNLNCGTTASDIIYHLITTRHLAHIRKHKQRDYLCDVCRQKFRNEKKWLSHISSTYHKLFCDKHLKLNETSLQEYECLTCQCILFGDEKCALIHQEQKKTRKKQAITLKRDVLELFKDENTTERVALVLRRDILKDEEKDAELVTACLCGFEDALKKIYPKCRAYPFGSRVTGIGNSKSDLDVFVDIGDMYFDSTNQKRQQDIVLKVKKILLENKRKFSDIVAITNARTPIIRVVHTLTNIDCDLSFRHGLSVENTKFMSFCFDSQPVTRLAMLTLKRWADMINLKDEITSYALCMMFIFYMQVNGFLLSVQKLRELMNEHVPTIDGWEVIDYTKSPAELIHHLKRYDGTVFALLKGFFKMYSEFEFEKLVVCPLLGKPILVKHFQNKGETLPPEMANLAIRLNSDPECKFKISSMCVQDPFDLAHNLTKAIFKSYREKYMMLCQLTYAHMALLL